VTIVQDMAAINACDLGVVCVPTPQGGDGHCNTALVEKTVRWLTTPIILIKSTVAVGTTDRLKAATGKRLVFSPEYCGESSYWTPYRFHTEIVETPFFVFGGDPADTSPLVDCFMKVAGPTKRYLLTAARTAEMAKYMENTFYATKITFCYETAEICRALGVDYNEAREVWLADPRLNPMHTAVFADNDLPFSGKCLTKDLAALVETARAAGYAPALLDEVQKSNRRIGELRRSRRGGQTA
jgi:nucleotide sugar dehydrogenase